MVSSIPFVAAKIRKFRGTEMQYAEHAAWRGYTKHSFLDTNYRQSVINCQKN